MTFFPKPRLPDLQPPSAKPAAEAGEAEGQAVQQAVLMPPYMGPHAAPRGAVLQRPAPPAGDAPHSVPAAGSSPDDPDQSDNPVAELVRRAAEEVQERVQGALQRRGTRPAAPPPAQTPPAPRQPAQRQPVQRQPVQRATPVAPRPAPRPRQAFDPVAYAQAGLLNLAWNWAQSGAPLRAIHTYMQVLIRYPGTPAADAAIADLVELSDVLAQQGQYHTALSIYDQLEQLA